MAQYWNDFSQYTVDQAPSDWTERWVSGMGVVVRSGGDVGGKILEVPAAASAGRRAAAWNAIDADAGRANVEVLFKWRVTSGLSSDIQLKALLRGQGSASNEHGYVFGVDRVTTSGNRLHRYTNGSSGTITSDTYAPSFNTWYWTRARANGTTVSIKTWQDGTGEPGSWALSANDSNISGAGWVGLFNFAESRYEVDVFSVGTDGDTALTDPSMIGPSLTTPTATVTGVGTATGTVTTDTADGTAYAVVTASATPPSNAEIKAGTGALWSGNQAVSADGVLTFNATGLSGGQKWFHYVHTDAAADDSTVSTAPFHMPEIVNAGLTAIGSDRATAAADSAVTSGKVLMVMSLASDPAPSTQEILNAFIVPDAPSTVTATGADGEVTVAWGQPSNADGYKVHRATSNSFATSTVVSGVLPKTENSYLDGSVTNDTEYWYWVVAFNQAGDSTPGGPDSATPSETAGFFQTDFSGDTIGTTPADMTVVGTDPPTVETTAGAVGGVALRLVATGSGGSRRSAVFADVQSDLEILSRVRSNTDSNPNTTRIVARAGADPTQNAYFAEPSLDVNTLTIRKYVSGTITTIGTASLTLNINTWYLIRFRLIGTTLKAKIWESGTSEPGTGGPDDDGFQVKVTDASHASGTYGIGTFSPGTHEWDWFSAAFGGGTAPEIV